jgi:hypothetical protein
VLFSALQALLIKKRINQRFFQKDTLLRRPTLVDKWLALTHDECNPN